MTLLTLANEAQDLLSLPRSTVVISSTDQNVRTLLGVAQQEGRALMRRFPWESLLTEKTFTSTAAAIQTGAVASDFDRIVNHSMFNRTNVRHVAGPLNAEEWQKQQALTASVLTDAFRIQGGDMLIVPTPPATDTYAYEYVSKNFCQSSGGTGQAAWAADDDDGVLVEDLMLLGIIWRFRKARGFDYAEEFNEYEREVTQAMMRDGGKRTLSYAGDDSLATQARPPTVIDGNWPL